MPDGLPVVVLFDAGGTLVLQHPAEMGERLGMGIRPDDAFEAHYRTMAEFSALKSAGSDVTWDWWLERYFDRLGHPDPALAGPAIERGFGLWTWPIPGVGDALEALAGMGIRMAVVSNSDGSVRASLDLAGLGEYFELVVDSEEVGVKKPDPGIFHLTLGRLRVRPEHAWYVGDSAFHDLGGARAAGLAEAWLVDPLGLHDGPGRIGSVAELPNLI
jgi:HAD superfamily hydrolase (TIGR01509 family)